MPVQLPFEIISEILTYAILSSIRDDVTALSEAKPPPSDQVVDAKRAITLLCPSTKTTLSMKLVCKAVNKEVERLWTGFSAHPAFRERQRAMYKLYMHIYKTSPRPEPPKMPEPQDHSGEDDEGDDEDDQDVALRYLGIPSQRPISVRSTTINHVLTDMSGHRRVVRPSKRRRMQRSSGSIC